MEIMTFEEHLLEAMARFLSVMLSVRCPACAPPDAVTEVEKQGPTLVESMFRSGNPEYAIDDDMQEQIKLVWSDIVFVNLCMVAETKLMKQSRSVLEEAHLPQADANIYIDSAVPIAWPQYASQRVVGFDQLYRVGGFGLRLLERVIDQATCWVRRMDGLLVDHHRLGALSQADSAALDATVVRLAHLVANRVAITEPSNAHWTTKLSAENCEHSSKLELMRCEPIALLELQRDILALDFLAELLRGNRVHDDHAVHDTNTTRHREICRLLSDPPPELRSELAKFPEHLTSAAVGELRHILSHPLAQERANRVVAWLDASTQVVRVLGHAAVRAAVAARAWSRGSPFVDVLRQKRGSTRVPRATWLATTTPQPSWWLRSSKTVFRRRLGLDALGTRVVLLSSAIHQLLGDMERPIFTPGAVASSLVYDSAMKSLQISVQAMSSLKTYMRPLCVGIEFDRARRAILDAGDSEAGSKMLEAACQVSQFSYHTLQVAFAPKSRFLIMNAEVLNNRVRQLLVVKPPLRFTAFVENALTIALPAIQQQRESIGLRTTSSSNVIGDLLRLVPAIRRWQQPTTRQSGPLVLKPKEVAEAPVQVRLMLNEVGLQSGLVKRRRLGTHEVYQFCPQGLKTVLQLS